jgi:hypothetical protein
MKRLAKLLKWLLLVLVGFFVVAQFFGPAKTNPPVDQSQTLQSRLEVPPQVNQILDRSCRDCHSNLTRWPWYAHVAPVSWFVINHVNEGRGDLNFSEWGRYDKSEVGNLLRNICRETRAGAMPIGSYTILHRGTELSEDEVKTLCDWSAAERAKLTTP